MLHRFAFAAALIGLSAACSPNFQALEPDNPDALGDIPDAPPVVGRDDAEESPYDEPAEEPEEPIDDEPEEPQQEAEEPEPEPEVEEPEPEVEEPVFEEPEPEPEVEEPEPEPEPDPWTPEPDCPAGVVCIDSLPAVETSTTVGGSSLFDSYSCAPGTDESGPEVIYEIELPTPGFLAVTLSGLPAGVDVDVHLLTDVDANACVDRGHWDAASLLPAGTYYVVVDSWVDNAGTIYDGSYTVRMQHTPYDALVAYGLDSLVLERSLTAFDNAWRDGETSKLIYTIADFTMSSAQRRLWTFDLANGQLLFHQHVSHGSNSSSSSNPAMVAAMSNTNGSHMSSVGLMRTAETYYGSNGYSMRLDGLESGYNDAVRPRAIVMHEATYATASFAATNGYLGRSWGCPAVDPAVNQALIDTIKNGTLYMSYFDDSSWLASSSYL